MSNFYSIHVFCVCFAVLITFWIVYVNTSVHQSINSKVWKNDTESLDSWISYSPNKLNLDGSTHEAARQKRCIKRQSFTTYQHRGDNRRSVLPNDAAMKMMNEIQLMELYFRYINSLQILCRNQTRLGSMRDGGKEICEDDVYKPQYPCLVYSFGSKFQFDFELDVIRVYKCEVHTFDPSLPIGNRSIPLGIHFHLIGLSNKSMMNKRGWKMETLSSIRKLLKHTHRTIDVLKIDIESGEWVVFPEMIQSGVLNYVKQICIEVHFNGKPQQLTTLRQLYEHGFYIFMREHNLVAITKLENTYRYRSITRLNEISLINVQFKETEHEK